MDFKIEKNIPIPQAKGKYPFSKMVLGDSFKFDVKIILTVRNSAYSWVSRFGRGKRFLVKKIDKAGRCWRVK